MKKIIIICALMLPIGIMAQVEEKEENKKAAEIFMKQFNAEDYGAIHDSYHENRKKKSDKSETISFFKRVRAETGKLISMTFTGYENEKYAKYEAKFERTDFRVSMYVDKELKIKGLFILK